MLDTVRDAATEIAQHYDDGRWWRNRFLGRVVGPTLGALHGYEGENVMDRDWDNLLVLDACRADMFEETLDIDQFDAYCRMESMGASSPEWMRRTFAGREFPGTVYVSANPWISKVAPDAFADVVNLWIETQDVDESELQAVHSLSDAGLGDVNTIYPERLNEAVRDVAAACPNKRLLVHYFQPHAPCIGRSNGERRSDVDESLDPGPPLRAGDVSARAVREGYRENLAYVFAHADELAQSLGGKTAFTADHGELFGEWCWPFPIRGYAHPTGLHHPSLTTVPWAVSQYGDRREIRADGVTARDVDERAIDDHLRDLGYI